jgi:hypothetical protein
LVYECDLVRISLCGILYGRNFRSVRKCVMYVCVCKILSILFSSNITWHTYNDTPEKISGCWQLQFKFSIAVFRGLKYLLSVLLVSATLKSAQLHPINTPRFWLNGFNLINTLDSFNLINTLDSFNLINTLDSTLKGFPPDACSFHIPLTGLQTMHTSQDWPAQYICSICWLFTSHENQIYTD